MKLPKSTEKNGGVLPRLLLLGIALAFIPLALLAQQQGPGWWYQLPSGGAGPISATGTANDYAAANAGQLKNMAAAAAAEFDSLGLTGTFDNMVAQWNTPTAQTSDYSAINLGQLKTVAQPFYDSLIAAGYLSGTDQYPWITSGNAPNDYAMANIGQVKNLFSFSTVPPVAPTNVVVQQNSDGSVTLTWTNNSVSASSVTIQESTDGGATWTQVATVSSNTTSYTIPAGSSGGSSATYQVSSTGGSGTASATPTPQPVPPVQSYAAIDVTGGAGVSGSVGAIALDDSNNGAYAYSSGGPATAQTWANGAPTSYTNVMPSPALITIGTTSYAGTVDGGNCLVNYAGTIFQVAKFPDSEGSLTYNSIAMSCANSISAPVNLATSLSGSFTYLTGLTTVSTYEVSANAYGGEVINSMLVDFDYICVGGTNTAFFENSGDLDNMGYTLPNIAYANGWFCIAAISDNGYAVGWDAVFNPNDPGRPEANAGPPAIWSPGSTSVTDTTLSKSTQLTAINNQGIFIGKDTDGFLWYNGTETALTSLIPSAYSSEISYITPRLISNADANNIIHILFDATYTDPTTGNTSQRTYVLSGPYTSLSSTSWALAQVQLPSGMSTANIHCINANGVLATANLPADGVSSSPVVGVLPPLQLTQSNYPTGLWADATDTGPTGTQTISSGTGANSIAYITGAPAMPQLSVQFANGSTSGMTVTWSMNITSERTQRGTQDNYQIPLTGGTTIPINQAWNISNSFVAPADFVGGNCVINYQINDASGNSLVSGTYPFIIRGANPMDADAKEYIQNTSQAQTGYPDVYQFAWEIIQHESREGDTVYNQFNSTEGVTGQPNYSADGKNGWGIAQLDNPLGKSASTEQVYNWQTNVSGFYGELADKIATQQRFFAMIASKYPSAPPPPATYTVNGTTMSSLAAGSIVLYNGAGGCNTVTYNGVTYQNPWYYTPSGGWSFTDNVNNYLHAVVSEITASYQE